MTVLHLSTYILGFIFSQILHVTCQKYTTAIWCFSNFLVGSKSYDGKFSVARYDVLKQHVSPGLCQMYGGYGVSCPALQQPLFNNCYDFYIFVFEVGRRKNNQPADLTSPWWVSFKKGPISSSSQLELAVIEWALTKWWIESGRHVTTSAKLGSLTP